MAAELFHTDVTIGLNKTAETSRCRYTFRIRVVSLFRTINFQVSKTLTSTPHMNPGPSHTSSNEHALEFRDCAIPGFHAAPSTGAGPGTGFLRVLVDIRDVLQCGSSWPAGSFITMPVPQHPGKLEPRLGSASSATIHQRPSDCVSSNPHHHRHASLPNLAAKSEPGPAVHVDHTHPPNQCASSSPVHPPPSPRFWVSRCAGGGRRPADCGPGLF